MQELLSFAVLGLGAAGIYTLLAQGIVVIFRGSGIVNFALGSFAMLGSYLFVELREAGLSNLPAIAASVAVIALLGAISYTVVIRPLKSASPLTMVIATLGLMMIFNAVATLRWGGTPKVYLQPILPSDPVSILGTIISSDRLYLLGVGIIATLVLWLIYGRTTFGLATTASAENPTAAATLGWSAPAIGTVNWAIGTGLAALAGILIIPIFSGLEITRLTLVVIYALAVALIANFRSFPLVLLGGIVVGVVESTVARYLDGSIPGASATVPLLVIVVLLVVRGNSLPDRSVVLQRLPRLGSGNIRPGLLGGAIILGGLILVFASTHWIVAITISLTAALIMLSIVVLTGYSGQLSLAQYAIAGFGAWVAARLVADFGFPFELALLIAVLAAIPLGLLFAIPALRTRGLYLAAVTLALGVAVQQVLFNNVALTGGRDGIIFGPQTLFGISIDPIEHASRYATVCLVAFLVCALAVTNLRRGRAGRRLIAVRTNERAAASLGISVVGAKLYGFAVSSAIAALGGVLLAFEAHSVQFSTFSALHSILIVVYAVIGGLGFLAGPLIGSLLVVGGVVTLLADEVLESLGIDHNLVVQYIALVGGVGVIVMLIQAPDGMAALVERQFRGLAARFPVINKRRPAGKTEPQNTELHKVDPKTLTVEGLTVRFGGVTAVDNASLVAQPGKILGLIGPNGAGKTTLVDAVTGFVPLAEGSIGFGGERIDSLRPHQRARMGITRSFQSLELFEDLTIRENILAAADQRDLAAYATNLVKPGRTELTPQARAAIHEFELVDHLDKLPPELSYGQRRLVAIARALAAGPSTLLLDEPAAGLDEQETSELATMVRRLADDWGIGILLIEHDVTFVMNVCDEIVVLDFGKTIAHGTPAEVRSNPAVIAAYLGSDDDDTPATSAYHTNTEAATL
ncbi:ABC transporter permease subunit [Rhodococcus koreensis]